MFVPLYDSLKELKSSVKLVIGQDDQLFSGLYEKLEPFEKVVFLIDSNVYQHWKTRIDEEFCRYGERGIRFLVGSGEASKRFGFYRDLIENFLRAGVTHDSAVVVVGGGTLGNVGGFVASTFQRGIALFQVPTTLMAQVDAMIDFKHAINLNDAKNQVGTYFEPNLILVNPAFLRSLPRREMSSGAAEILKHGMTHDLRLLDLASDAKDSGEFESLVAATIKSKADLLSRRGEDWYSEMAMQYGHAIGHAVEHESGHSLNHGEAISIGMVATSHLTKHLLGHDLIKEHRGIFEDWGLPTSCLIPLHRVLCAMVHDKHSVGNSIRIGLLSRLGQLSRHEEEDYGFLVSIKDVRASLLNFFS
ncbi:MAG: hypothetical protein P1U86_06355 [Verrucomicrobiales bacterium]|nr:hypothetical protein [Verrucomicrobiales bacterium]